MEDLRIPVKRYRPEIEGVRTVATLLVAIYHIWLGRVSGGIDVFFVLSGFLITTSLLSRIERTGSVGFVNFIVGLAKRLFPQALFVTLTVGISAIFIIPKVQWESLASHILASTFYFENWRLATDSVDYLTRDNATSPLQHFWSLSVQGQFYIICPLIITFSFILSRFILKTPLRKTLLAVLSTLFVLSISYSIYKTGVNQPWAYFDTFARLWEFSIGGIFALLLPYLRLNKYISTVAGWLGILIICLTGIVLPVSTVFPSYLALVPISGVLLIIIASENSTSIGIDKFLGNKIFGLLGSLTYGFYLWHWSLLFSDAIIIITFSFILSRFILKTPLRKTLLAVLSTLFVLSISYSIYKTGVNQPWAYFDTFARLWEFSIGGIFALLLPYLRLNKYISTVAGWVGILIICLTGIVLPVSTVFPSYLALVPISGVLLIIIASENSTSIGIDKFLGNKIFGLLGSLTYGFYLWHWSLLIFYQTAFDVQDVSLAHGLLILLATLILSYISTNLVEKPIRKLDIKRNKVKLYGSLSTLLILVVSMTFGYVQYVDNEKERTITASASNLYLGARALYENIEVKEGVDPLPSLLTLNDDVPNSYKTEECLSDNLEKAHVCHFGVLDNPEYTVAVVGGSHSAHWMPALEILAEEMNFKIDLYNHDGCRFTTKDPNPEFDYFTDKCLKWNDNVIEVLKKDPPDLVFAPSTLNKREVIPQGFINQWVKLDGYTHIFGIRDNPRMVEHPAECIERVEDLSECSVPRDEALSKVAPWENTEGIPDNVYFADLSDAFCDEDTCDLVIGNIIVYRDIHHITKTYMETIAPMLKAPLQEAFDLLDSGTFEQHRKSGS